MIRKTFIFFLGFFSLLGGMFVSAQKFDMNYFLNQPDTVLSPVYPWHAERPNNVFDFLTSPNTPYRTKWQKEPFAPQYRFSRDFVRSDYQRWRDLDLRGFGITDEEDLSGSYCRYQNSIIGKDFLTDVDIAGRCCVCGVGGEWQCQYSHVKEDRQCMAPDLAITNVVFIQDESFSSFAQEKYYFDAVIKNNGGVNSNDFTVSVQLDGEEIASNTFYALQENQQFSISQLLFPSIDTGIIVSAGEHELKIAITTEGSEELNIENNEHIELLSVSLPQHDFLIRSVNISQTGNINEDGQEELAFEVMVKNEGDYFARVPSSYTIELLTDPDFPAFYSEVVEEELIPGDSFVSEFSIYGETGSYIFFVKVIPSSEDEANLENNISEVPFIVY